MTEKKRPAPTINDLPLTEGQKRRVLEWYAHKLWRIAEEGFYRSCVYCERRYNAIVINEDIVLRGGSSPEDLGRLEEEMTKEIIYCICDELEYYSEQNERQN